MGKKRDRGGYMPIVSILPAIIALSILIIAHELGHFLAAKHSGIDVLEFSLGFGPRIFRLKRNETEYSIRLFLLGGYVKMAGDERMTASGSEREFFSKSANIRAKVIFSGPLSSFILAVLFYSCVNLFYGIGVIDTTVIQDAPEATTLLRGDQILSIQGTDVSDWWDVIKTQRGEIETILNIEREDDTISVSILSCYIDSIIPLVPSMLGHIEKGSPACNAGLRRADRVIQINGVKVDTWEDMVGIIQKSANDSLIFLFNRQGEPLTTSLIPDERETLIDGELKKVGMIGVAGYTKRRGLGLSSFYQGVKDAEHTIYLTVSFLRQLIIGRMTARRLGGPISIVRFAGQSLAWGPWTFISFMAFLSCQLAILNLIPFPPLDGGHLLLTLIEKIKRRPLSQKVVSIIAGLGFALLILLMLYVTMNDIIRIFS